LDSPLGSSLWLLLFRCLLVMSFVVEKQAAIPRPARWREYSPKSGFFRKQGSAAVSRRRLVLSTPPLSVKAPLCRKASPAPVIALQEVVLTSSAEAFTSVSVSREASVSAASVDAAFVATAPVSGAPLSGTERLSTAQIELLYPGFLQDQRYQNSKRRVARTGWFRKMKPLPIAPGSLLPSLSGEKGQRPIGFFFKPLPRRSPVASFPSKSAKARRPVSTATRPISRSDGAVAVAVTVSGTDVRDADVVIISDDDDDDGGCELPVVGSDVLVFSDDAALMGLIQTIFSRHVHPRNLRSEFCAADVLRDFKISLPLILPSCRARLRGQDVLLLLEFVLIVVLGKRQVCVNLDWSDLVRGERAKCGRLGDETSVLGRWLKSYWPCGVADLQAYEMRLVIAMFNWRAFPPLELDLDYIGLPPSSASELKSDEGTEHPNGNRSPSSSAVIDYRGQSPPSVPGPHPRPDS